MRSDSPPPVSVTRRVARVMGFVLAGCAGLVVAVVLVGVLLSWMVQESWNPSSRRDADARCPARSGQAEVQIGGWGEPDRCLYRDESGRVVGHSLLAGPAPANE